MNLGKSLKIESVGRLHFTPPVQVQASQTVAEAVEVLRRQSVGCLLVCEGDRLVGIFTERDLLRRVLACRRPFTAALAECMTPGPRTVNSKESIAAAVQRMEAGGYRHLPVVDEAARPVGVLSVKRIVHYLVEHFPGTIYNLPPSPNAASGREGA